MAGAVVDRLEAIEVQPHDAEFDPDPLAARHLLAQAGVELAPVRQAGQNVGADRLRERGHKLLGTRPQPAHDHSGDEQATGQHQPLQLTQLDSGAQDQDDGVGDAGHRAADHRPAQLEEVEGGQRDPEVEERVGARGLGAAQHDRQGDQQVAEHRRDAEEPKRQTVVSEDEQPRGQVGLDRHSDEGKLGAVGGTGEQQGDQRQGAADPKQPGEGAGHQRLVLDDAGRVRVLALEPQAGSQRGVEMWGQLDHPDRFYRRAQFAAAELSARRAPATTPESTSQADYWGRKVDG